MSDKEAIEIVKEKINEFENVINQIRIVKNGDPVYTNDINLKIKALNILKDIFDIGEKHYWLRKDSTMSFGFNVSMLFDKKYGDYVFSDDWKKISKLILEGYDLLKTMCICIKEPYWVSSRCNFQRTKYYDSKPCFALSTIGEHFCKIHLDYGVDFTYYINHETYKTPIVDDNLNVYFVNNIAEVYSFDIDNNFRFKTKISDYVYGGITYHSKQKLLFCGFIKGYSIGSAIVIINGGLICLDTNGSILWAINVGYDNMTPLVDKYGFIYMEYFKKWESPPAFGVIKTDTNGNIIWDIGLPNSWYSYIEENGGITRWIIWLDFSINDDYIYALDLLNKIYCVNLDGNVIWSTEIDSYIQKYPEYCGKQATVYHEGHIYIGSYDGYLYKIDANSGEIIWKYISNDTCLEPPSIYKKQDLLISIQRGIKIICVDATSKLIWIITLDTIGSTDYHGSVSIDKLGNIYIIVYQHNHFNSLCVFNIDGELIKKIQTNVSHSYHFNVCLL